MQDGKFSQPVTWLENNELPKNINQTNTVGVYEFYGRVAGLYQLTATYQTLSQMLISKCSLKHFDFQSIQHFNSNIGTIGKNNSSGKWL